jgi:Transglutaminase-like superfamily
MRVDLRLVVRMTGWVIVLPVLKRVRPLHELARLMWCDARAPSPRERELAVLSYAEWLYRGRPLFGDNCLERSLLLYRFLSEAGLEPTLIVGAQHDGLSVAAHAWVEIDGRPIGNADGYEPVVAFGPHGRRVAAT